jgi:hypothetical protein
VLDAGVAVVCALPVVTLPLLPLFGQLIEDRP